MTFPYDDACSRGTMRWQKDKLVKTVGHNFLMYAISNAPYWFPLGIQHHFTKFTTNCFPITLRADTPNVPTQNFPKGEIMVFIETLKVKAELHPDALIKRLDFEIVWNRD